MQNYIVENIRLKQEIARYKHIFSKVPYIDDSLLRGSYRVVKDILERDNIPTCYRKYGMKVMVVGTEETGLFREYILNSKKLNNVWEEVIIEVPITEVFEETVQLTEDYSLIANDLESQRDLNLALTDLLTQLREAVENLDIPNTTSDLVNDGEDGIHPFITAQDIPEVDLSGKLDKPIQAPQNGEILKYYEGQNVWSPDTSLIAGKNITIANKIVDVKLPSTAPVSNRLASVGNYPFNIVRDSAGNLYTANYWSDNVTKVTPDGVATVFATLGQYARAQGIAIDAQGNIFVGLTGYGYINKITPAGVVTVFATVENWPDGIAIDAQGTLYVANYYSNTVTKITAAGVKTRLGWTDSMPKGILVDPAGNVFVCNFGSNNVTKITPQGVSSIYATTGAGPTRIVRDSTGNLYTCNATANTVTKISAQNVSVTFGTTGNSPQDIAIDSAGNIYTANAGSKNVTKITPNGVSSVFGTTELPINGLVLDPAGNIYVVEGYSNSNSDGYITKLTVNNTKVLALDDNENIILLDRPDTSTQIKNLIDNKLDKPTQDGSWVVTKSGATVSYTDASTLGKNIANSNLTSIANSSFTLGANYTINTSGYYFNITNLPDKSADVSFNKMMVQNSTGQVAWGNGKTLIKNMPSSLSEAEKNTWKTEMNGGWTTNTMSVALINPVISDNKSIKYLTIYGANLNLNPTNFKMEIMDETGLNVIAEIPNSQVILTDSSNLTFWYDFTGFSLGNFKLRLNNGVTLYVTPITFSIVTSLQVIDFTDNVWEKTTYNGIENPTVQQSNSTISVQNHSNVVPLDIDGKITFTATSKPLGTMADDFVISFSLWNTANTNNTTALFGGLTNEQVPSNTNNILAGAKCIDQHTIQSLTGANIGSRGSGNQIILMKRGSFLTVVVTGNTTFIYTATVGDQSTLPVRLKMAYINSYSSINIANLQILSAYKLN